MNSPPFETYAQLAERIYVSQNIKCWSGLFSFFSNFAQKANVSIGMCQNAQKSARNKAKKVPSRALHLLSSPFLCLQVNSYQCMGHDAGSINWRHHKSKHTRC